MEKELEGRGYSLDVQNPFYDYATLKAEYKLYEDSGDKWGSAMSCLFALASELWMRGAYEAPEWGYNPGLADDPREPDDYFYDVFIDAKTDALQQFGNVLHRYIEALDKAGHGY